MTSIPDTVNIDIELLLNMSTKDLTIDTSKVYTLYKQLLYSSLVIAIIKYKI